MPIQDFKNSKGEWAKSSQIHGYQVYTKSRSLWKDIASRCKKGSYNQIKFPRYVGCSMSNNFKNFQFFAEWCQKQIGYCVEGYHIDKDLLTNGNKEYHEDKCVFIPASLNYFLCAANAIRGDLPQGVSLVEDKFRASISIDGKTTALGLFNSSKEASCAYKVAKEKEARRWVERLINSNSIVDSRVIDRLKIWTLEN